MPELLIIEPGFFRAGDEDSGVTSEKSYIQTEENNFNSAFCNQRSLDVNLTTNNSSGEPSIGLVYSWDSLGTGKLYYLSDDNNFFGNSIKWINTGG